MTSVTPTPHELRLLRSVLRHGITDTAIERGVTRGAVKYAMQSLYGRLGVEPHRNGFGSAVKAAEALGWLVIPDEGTCKHLIPAEECRVVGCVGA